MYIFLFYNVERRLKCTFLNNPPELLTNDRGYGTRKLLINEAFDWPINRHGFMTKFLRSTHRLHPNICGRVVAWKINKGVRVNLFLSYERHDIGNQHITLTDLLVPPRFRAGSSRKKYTALNFWGSIHKSRILTL